jgi:pyrroloquinoline-quinone synthase
MLIPVDLSAQLEVALTCVDLRAHPYFAMLESGAMSKTQFLHSQVEFLPIVRDYGQTLALLIARLPDAAQRSAIIDVLREEHGGGQPGQVHGQTLLTLIQRLGGDPALADAQAPSRQARLFNATLRGLAAFEEPGLAAAVFGAIERLFAEVSGRLRDALLERRWLPEEQIVHYAHHHRIDQVHAAAFLSVAARDWHMPERRPALVDGMRAGVALLADCYSALHANLPA